MGKRYVKIPDIYGSLTKGYSVGSQIAARKAKIFEDFLKGLETLGEKKKAFQKFLIDLELKKAKQQLDEARTVSENYWRAADAELKRQIAECYRTGRCPQTLVGGYGGASGYRPPTMKYRSPDQINNSIKQKLNYYRSQTRYGKDKAFSDMALKIANTVTSNADVISKYIDAYKNLENLQGLSRLDGGIVLYENIPAHKELIDFLGLKPVNGEVLILDTDLSNMSEMIKDAIDLLASTGNITEEQVNTLKTKLLE